MVIFASNINIFLSQDWAPDVKEPVVDSLEEEPAELTNSNEDKERPDIVDVEYEPGQEDDGEVLPHKETIYDQLALEAALLALVILLLRQRKD